MITRLRSHILIAIPAIIWTFFLVYLANKINFSSNDEWAFYKSVQAYLDGNFAYNPIQIFGKSAPLFYTQGFMAYLFALVFSIGKLPLLTALLSGINYYILSFIIFRFFNRSILLSLILAGIVVFNPIYVYSSLGFMTENYFIFFLLLTFYFYLRYEKESLTKNFIFFNVFMILGFFVRQFSILSSGAFALYLFLTKKYKHLAIQTFITLVLLLFYYFYFLANEKYSYKGVSLNPMRDFEYFHNLVFALLVTITAYTFPIVLLSINKTILKNKLFLILTAVCYIIFFALVYAKADPDGYLYNGEFPYLGNTIGRKGFYMIDGEGSKYHFMGIHKLYLVWQSIAIALAPLLVSTLLFMWKKALSFFGSFFWVYLLLLFVLTQIFDRYLSVLVLVYLLFVLSTKPKINRIHVGISGVFCTLLFVLAYQFASDFVYTRSYAWETAFRLVKSEGIYHREVIVSRSWAKNFNYEKGYGPARYLISYDAPNVVDKTICCTKLIEEKEIKFPFSFFVNPKIYVYEK